jgi:hypothetical protein
MFKTRTIFALLTTLMLMSAALVADEGRYVILSAQYGTSNRHVDVTNRLKELARSDRSFRMGNSTFGVDPDPGQYKVLRIYARGPEGRERMFEFREGSVVDGSMFRGWGRGDWGRGGWSGRWESEEGERGGGQPNMEAAMQQLRAAQASLQNASSDKGGHRVRAMQLIDQAMREVEEGMRYDNRH